MLHARSKMESKGAHFVGNQEQRFELWWSGNDVGSVGVEILVAKETSGSMKVRRKSASDGS